MVPDHWSNDAMVSMDRHGLDGGHNLWDERQFCGSPGHRPLARSCPSPPPDHRCSVRMQKRSLPKMDTWQTLYAPTPASASSQPEHPAVSIDGDQHDSHRPCTEPPTGHDGRRNCGASETEPADRAPTKMVAIDGQPGASANES